MWSTYFQTIQLCVAEIIEWWTGNSIRVYSRNKGFALQFTKDGQEWFHTIGFVACWSLLFETGWDSLRFLFHLYFIIPYLLPSTIIASSVSVTDAQTSKLIHRNEAIIVKTRNFILNDTLFHFTTNNHKLIIPPHLMARC